MFKVHISRRGVCMQHIHFTKVMDFSTDVMDGELKTINIDKNNNIVLFIVKDMCTSNIICINPKRKTKKYTSFQEDFESEDVLFVQTLGENFLIIFNHDSNNACLFDTQGNIINKFDVGKGIQDCQVDVDNNIWISYSDEGIFGESTMGENGIVAFNSQGNIVFNDYDLFVDKYDIPPIDDCYALNVDGNDVWLYYYSEFPLVQLKNKKLYKFWENIDIVTNAAVKGFSIVDDTVVFIDRNKNLVTYSLNTAQFQYMTPLDENGDSIDFINYYSRGSVLYLQTEEALYFVEFNNEKFVRGF